MFNIKLILTEMKELVDQIKAEYEVFAANADAQVSKLKTKGFDAFVTTNGGGTAASGDTPKKSNTEIAKEVIAGKWGNGADRKKRLEAAGYNYAAVQKIVNSML